MLNYIVAPAIIVGAIFCSDTPGKQPPCLHERIFAGQRIANGIGRELSAVSRGSDRGRDFPYPIDTPGRRRTDLSAAGAPSGGQPGSYRAGFGHPLILPLIIAANIRSLAPG